MFRCKTVLLEMLTPVVHPSFQVLEAKEPGHGRMVGTRVEFLSKNVFVEVFNPHNITPIGSHTSFSQPWTESHCSKLLYYAPGLSALATAHLQSLRYLCVHVANELVTGILEQVLYTEL
jgi:hypothetical protein